MPIAPDGKQILEKHYSPLRRAWAKDFYAALRPACELTGQEKFARAYPCNPLNSGGKPFALRGLKNELRFNFTVRCQFARGNDFLSRLCGNEHTVGYIEHGRDYSLKNYVEARNLKELLARHAPEQCYEITLSRRLALQQAQLG